jgi:hypothetical protein
VTRMSAHFLGISTSAIETSSTARTQIASVGALQALARRRQSAHHRAMKTRTEVVAESQRKGFAAGLATTAAVAAGATCGSAIVAAIAAVPALFLGVRWWKHRSENGIRF